MPLPDLRTFCIDIDVTPGEVCLTFPGGAEMCVTMPDTVPPSPDKLMRQLFAQANAAMAPLTPIFNIVDAVIAVFDCIKAITTLDPEKMLNCIPRLAEKVQKLLNLIPQLSIVSLVAGILEILILWLRGMHNQATRARQLLVRVLNAETAARRPGNLALANMLPCALSDLDKLLLWQNEGAKPVNRLIGVVNTFLEIIGLDKFTIPCLGQVVADLESIDLYLKLIGLLEKLLLLVRTFIPVWPNFALDAVAGGVAKGC